jgi:hypothetical protein
MIDQNVLLRSDALSATFQSAKPFKYLCIDNFFNIDAAEQLLSDFPVFDPNKALNEFGEVGRKAVHTALSDIGPFYAAVYDYLLSEAFLRAMSGITGIPDLLPDPRMYGGGTHENADGQEMDPHVDFNYDQDHGYHRRLNLILYLNKDWDESWGGAIELHSNPRTPDRNDITAFNCIFNRAVIFETNEYSWHGFKRVQLPEAERGRSRKSLSIYLYTRTRPQEEIAPSHGTFYVPRPLPFAVTVDNALSQNQITDLNAAIKHRDAWIEHYQKLELRLSAQLGAADRYIKELTSAIRAPITGAAEPTGKSDGLYHDGWAAPTVSFSARVRAGTTRAVLRGFIPTSVGEKTHLRVTVNGELVASKSVASGAFEIACKGLPSGREVTFAVLAEREGGFVTGQGDDRQLAFVLQSVEFPHRCRWVRRLIR